jgi:branched-chain amino acid transport system substrate-binding protein
VREYREYMNRYKPMPPHQLIGNESYPSLLYSSDSFEGFLNAKLLVEVLKRTDDSSQNAVKSDTVTNDTIGDVIKKIPRATQSIQDFDLGIGKPLSFRNNSNQALNTIDYTKIEKGRFVPLKSQAHCVSEALPNMPQSASCLMKF